MSRAITTGGRAKDLVRARIHALADAMNVRAGRDAAGDPCIWGRRGLHIENNIHADGNGFSLMISLDTRRRLTSAIDHLSFCALRQRGDREAVLYLDRMPTPRESEIIRRYMGIRKRSVLSLEQAEARRARMRAINSFRPKNEAKTGQTRQEPPKWHLPRPGRYIPANLRGIDDARMRAGVQIEPNLDESDRQALPRVKDVSHAMAQTIPGAEVLGQTG